MRNVDSIFTYARLHVRTRHLSPVPGSVVIVDSLEIVESIGSKGAMVAKEKTNQAEHFVLRLDVRKSEEKERSVQTVQICGLISNRDEAELSICFARSRILRTSCKESSILCTKKMGRLFLSEAVVLVAPLLLGVSRWD